MVHHRTAYVRKPITLAALYLFIGAGLAFPATSLAAERFETPVGFKVNETGAATFSIPIEVPPGIAGMEPNISLNYSSQGGDGLLGVGWSLGGLSAIYRCGRTLIQDGAKVTVNYNAGDRFCMDGQRLVAVPGAHGANNTEYRTERESFTKIISYGTSGTAGDGPAWFKAWTKAGRIIEFGNTISSAVQARDKNEIRVWAANKISDNVGNYLTINYLEDATSINFDFRPSSINYTYNANTAMPQAASYVKFGYEDKPDSTPLYQAGSEVRSNKRLINIQTGTAVGTLTELVKDYRLKYAPSPATQRSRLISVQECDGLVTSATAICLPATTIAWQSSNNSFFPATNFDLATRLLALSNKTQGHSLGDFNGDGKTDILKYSDTAADNRLYLSDGDGSFTESVNFNLKGDLLAHSNKTHGHSLGDFNGDGKTDILKYSDTFVLNKLYLSNGDGSFAESANFNLKDGYLARSNKTYGHTLGDFNGDGRTDILKYSDTFAENRLYLSDGDGSFTESVNFNIKSSPLAHSNKTQGNSLGDFNGDGKTDILKYTDTSANTLYLSDSAGSFTASVIFNLSTLLANSAGTIGHSLGDFNGDGKTDILKYTDTSANTLYLSNGDGLFTRFANFNLTSNSLAKSTGTHGHSLGDFNADGKTDILRYSSTPAQNILYLSSGNGTFRAYANSALATYGLTYLGLTTKGVKSHSLGDFNGDGKTDILKYSDIASDNRLYWEQDAVANDLVKSITTGLSTTTALLYKSLTDPSVYTKYADAIYPYLDIQAPLHVVFKSTVPDGIGGVRNTFYTYAGAKAHLRGGGFLGFNRVEVADEAAGIKTSTVFRQDYPYQGLPTSVTQAKATGSLLKSTVKTWGFTTYPDTVLPIATARGSKHHFSAITATLDKTFDLSDGSLVTQVGSTTQYDDYGNATEKTAATNDGYSTTVVNTYATPNLDKWFIGQLMSSEVTSTAPDNLSAPAPVVTPPPALSPTIHIAALEAVKSERHEGPTAFTFLISRDGDTTGSASVNWAVSSRGANAANAADFFGGSLPSGTESFVAGQTYLTFTVNIQGDTEVESEENFTVTLSNPSNAILGIASAIGIIRNDDFTPFIFTQSFATVASSLISPPPIITSKVTGYNLRYSAIAAGWDQISPLLATITIGTGVYVYAATALGYAFMVEGAYPYGSSISLINNGLILGYGSTGKAIYTEYPITINNKGTIGVAAGVATYTAGNVLITWLDRGIVRGDELNAALPPALNIAAFDANKVEGSSGATPYTFTASRRGDASGVASVNWAVTGFGANPANATDFGGGILPSGVLNFMDGQVKQTLTINVQGDTVFESGEGFAVTLSNPIKTSLGISKAVGIILNDDAGPSIIAPAAGSVFNTPADITITVAASEGVTSKVEFYDNGVLLGSSTTAPYNYLWSNAPAGAHQITAQATDYLGTVTPSAAVAITVNQLPTVSILTPAINNTFISPANITLTASATDSNGFISKVGFYEGNKLLGTATAAPYSYVWSNVPVGKQYITAIATDNQGAIAISPGISIDVVNNMDLVMTAVATTATSVAVGSSLAINNTEKNQVTPGVAASSHSIKFYLSLDRTITSTDILIGSRLVAALAVGASNTLTTSIIVPKTVEPGTYYIGAIADADNTQPEANEINNALASIATIVVKRDVDLVMTAISTLATSVAVGKTFVVSNTEKNSGTTVTTASTHAVNLYLSPDATITTSDILIGSRTVAVLVAAAVSTISTTATVPTNVEPGTYYIGAIADATNVQPETNATNNSETNNSLAGKTIVIEPNVDLVMAEVGTTAPSVAVDKTFVISNAEKNAGAVATTASIRTVKFYLSIDATITSTDTLIGSRTAGVLAVGASSAAMTTVTVPTTVGLGVYYIGAIADATNVQLESDETNNALAGGTIVVAANIDLVMAAVSTTATSVAVGETLVINNAEKNLGTVATTASIRTVKFYLSADATFTDTDILIGTRTAPALAVGASSVESTTVTVPADMSLGTYYIGAIADATNVQPEANETNNALAATATIVVARNVDLLMTAVRAVTPNAEPGSILMIDTTEKNQGTSNMTAANNTVNFYLSTDATITSADTLLTETRTVPASALMAGASSIGSTAVTVPTTMPLGIYFIGACADAGNVEPEKDETNNCLIAPNTIAIVPDVDLVMTEVKTGVASAHVGGVFTINNTEQNLGLASATASHSIKFYLSLDDVITSTDTPIGSRTITTALAAGVTNSQFTSVTIPKTVEPGTYYIGAITDSLGQQLETNETNNERASITSLSVIRDVDLIMTAITTAAGSVRVGSSFTISSTERNQGTTGTTAASHNIKFYLSPGPYVNRTTGIFIGSRSVINLAAMTSGLATTTTVTVPANLTPGTYYIGAFADADLKQPETNENNNSLAGKAITVTQ